LRGGAKATVSLTLKENSVPRGGVEPKKKENMVRQLLGGGGELFKKRVRGNSGIFANN